MLVVTLTVRREALVPFRDYEGRAVAIMRRHGGVLERTVFVDDGPADPLVKEVHLLTFPDRGAFERYRADPDLAAAAPLRAQAVVATELLVGVEGLSYDDHPTR